MQFRDWQSINWYRTTVQDNCWKKKATIIWIQIIEEHIDMRFGAYAITILDIKQKFCTICLPISSIAPIAQCILPIVIAAPPLFYITAARCFQAPISKRVQSKCTCGYAETHGTNNKDLMLFEWNGEKGDSLQWDLSLRWLLSCCVYKG